MDDLHADAHRHLQGLRLCLRAMKVKRNGMVVSMEAPFAETFDEVASVIGQHRFLVEREMAEAG